jgi:histidine ammonia-lyase
MGANAAVKCNKVLDNTESVLGILLLASAQALEFRRPLQSSPVLENLMKDFRTRVSFRQADTVFKTDMDEATRFVKTFNLADYES